MLEISDNGFGWDEEYLDTIVIINEGDFILSWAQLSEICKISQIDVTLKSIPNEGSLMKLKIPILYNQKVKDEKVIFMSSFKRN